VRPGLPGAVVALAVLLVAPLSGCDDVGPDRRAGPTSSTPTTGVPTAPISSARAQQWLADLRTIDRHPSVPPYARDAFGSAWADTDGNGCNQRDDVLLRDAQPGTTRVQQQGRCDHDVLAGTWVDPYTGKVLVFDDLKDPRQAQGVQIDHIVPLAEAWLSGASAWSEERRRLYANDLPGLVASDGPTNASKGADDPAAWRPKSAHQCAYAVRWIRVKHRWRLGVDDSERAALADMLGLCPQDSGQ